MKKESLYLGIDVSKGYADFVMLNQDQELVEEAFQLDDNANGHACLGEILEKYTDSKSDLEIRCGLESTGGYERNWYHYLVSLSENTPVKVALLNPVVVKGISKASKDRTITDNVSAKNIAIYLLSYGNKVVYHQDSVYADIFESGRSLYSLETMLNKQKTQLSNQLEKVIYQHFPEITYLFKHKTPVWVLRVLSKYPSAEKIRKAGLEKLMKIPGIGSSKATMLISKLDQCKGKQDDHVDYIIKHTASEIMHKDDKIKECKAFLEKKYKDHPAVKLLTTIKGIGTSSAISILFEIVNIKRFRSAKALAAYFGVNPESKESGDDKWKSHMAKKGRKKMRAVLYMACMTAKSHDPILRKKYADCRAKGKNHYFAMGVIMHKMLRIIYGILKSGKAYDPQIDQKNQKRSFEKQAEIKEIINQQERENLKKRRRYQGMEMVDCPISRRKAKKMKELESSQEPVATQSYGINTSSSKIKNK